ncbi:MAG: flavin reductase [Pseudomonadota bacterium]|nr:flavin reductase [Pseudomonadota bacterium]
MTLRKDSTRAAVTAAPGQDEFRAAMSRLAGAVNIVTTDGPAGRAGFTASAVCSVTDTPPTLLVCCNRTRSLGAYIEQNTAIAVNTLAPEHEALAAAFGGKETQEDRFERATWSRLVSGAPILEGSLVSFDCRIATFSDVGTHRVLFCEIEAIQLGRRGSASIWFDRGFHRVGEPA